MKFLGNCKTKQDVIKVFLNVETYRSLGKTGLDQAITVTTYIIHSYSLFNPFRAYVLFL